MISFSGSSSFSMPARGEHNVIADVTSVNCDFADLFSRAGSGPDFHELG
jgi:hypothetical protein